MPAMALPKGLELVAELIEADLELSHSNICTSLGDALRDIFAGQTEYVYVCDVFGDASSGDVVYCTGRDCYRAPYTIEMVNGKRSTTVNTDQAIDVVPRTVYDEEADEGDHYAAMEAERLYRDGGRPLVERFVSKDERAAASSDDFAGKGKSFPILKPADVMAAVRSMGRAGTGNYSADTIKANIVRIAKRKGWAKYLPSAWQDKKESAVSEHALVGDVVDLREGAVGLDGSANLKLIAPGWGSSGYYSKEVLKRDGPKIFKAGTQNFWDHPTETEEAERPEGSLRDLASVLTEDAHYDESGPAGPGLYARAKVFPEFREHVDALAPHIGTSIRASGISREGEAEGRKGPIIERLTRATSVDYVTRPGAGGKVLQLFEAARSRKIRESATSTEVNMDQATLTKLQETVARQDAELKKLRERAALADAGTAIDGLLGELRINPAIKARVKRRVLEAGAPLTEAGELDSAKLKTVVEAEVNEECAYIERIAPTGRPAGLGTAAAVKPEDAEKALDEAHKATMTDLADFFCEDSTGDAGKRMRESFINGRAN